MGRERDRLLVRCCGCEQLYLGFVDGNELRLIAGDDVCPDCGRSTFHAVEEL